MRNKPILFILLICLGVPGFAQNLITCSSERNADNSISIFAESQAAGEYTVKVTFTSFSGYTSSEPVYNNIALVTVQRGKREIIKLTQDKSGSMFSFQYRYQYFPGRVLDKTPDISFVYLIPSTPGNHIRVSDVSSLQELVEQQRPDDFNSTGFLYNLGDTICAARAGYVYECNGEMKEGEKANQRFTRARNRIAIQHKDGSYGFYSVLAPVQLLVSEGDFVVPGKPIAIFNKESEKYTVLLSTYYLDRKKLLSDKATNSSCTVNIPNHFYTGENDKSVVLLPNSQYIIQHPASIIGEELSKKEKKKAGLL